VSGFGTSNQDKKTPSSSFFEITLPTDTVRINLLPWQQQDCKAAWTGSAMVEIALAIPWWTTQRNWNILPGSMTR